MKEKQRPSARQAELLARAMAGLDGAGPYHMNTVRSCVERGWVEVVDGRIRLMPGAPVPDGEVVKAAAVDAKAMDDQAMMLARRHFQRLNPPQRAEFVRWATGEVVDYVEGRS
jgi:hypothetical protein